MSGNVIYGIDLNPAFKPRAIIQSRSPFPSSSVGASMRLCALRLLLSLDHVLSLKGTFDTRYIYLGTSELLPFSHSHSFSFLPPPPLVPSLYPFSRSACVIYIRVPRTPPWLLKASFTLSSSITDRFLYEIIAPLDLISRLVILFPPLPPVNLCRRYRRALPA